METTVIAGRGPIVIDGRDPIVIAGRDPAISRYDAEDSQDYRVKPDNDTILANSIHNPALAGLERSCHS